MKKALKIGLVAVAVLVAALAVAWFYIDSIAKAAIERGGTYALGVDTKVDSVSLSLLKGQVRIDGLKVSNPEGFKTPHLMKAGRIEVGVRPGSLTTDTVEVNRFEIEGLDMHIEQKLGSTNVSALLANIKARTGGEGKKEEPKDAGGKKVKVDRIVVRNTVAHVQVLPIGGSATTLDVKVPEIIMKDVTSDNAGGVAISELMRRLVPAVLAAVVDKAKGVIPDADLKKLGGDIASTTQAIGQGAANLVQQAGGDAAKALEGLGAGAQKTGEAIQKGVGGALEKIFGAKKPDQPDKPK